MLTFVSSTLGGHSGQQHLIMKTISLHDAVAMIPDGASLMIGGFMGVGTPERLVDELVRQGKRDLTVIANDNAMPGVGIGKLVSAGLVRQDDRQPHRAQPRDAEEDACRRDGGRTGAAGHADRAHPGRRATGSAASSRPPALAPSWRRASSASRSTAGHSCWRPRCAPTSRWCRLSCRLRRQSAIRS